MIGFPEGSIGIPEKFPSHLGEEEDTDAHCRHTAQTQEYSTSPILPYPEGQRETQ